MTIDYLVIFVYALFMLGFGFLGMRRAKTRDDYLVAGRRLGPGFYMGTLSAVVLGGASTIGSVKLGYQYGLSGFWLAGSLGLGVIGISLLLAKPLMRMRIYTVTQVLALRYDNKTKTLSAVVMIAYDLMVAVTSSLALGTLMQVVLGMNPVLAILLGGGIVVLYSVVGGMWSLTLTDIIQFVIMTIGIVFVLMPMSIDVAGGWTHLTQTLPAAYFTLDNIGLDTILTYFVIYFFGVLIGQDIWQRVFSARSERVAQYAGASAGVYCILYGMAAAMIGMAAKIVLPDMSGNTDQVFAQMTVTVLPNGVRGLVVAAALAALMSTASACLLASSTIAVQDLWPDRKTGAETAATSEASDASEASETSSKEVRKYKLATLLMGVAMLVISLLVKDVIAALTIAYNVLVGCMLVPLIGAIYWKRASTTGAMAALTGGGIAVIGFMIKDGLDANSPVYAGLAVSFAAFVIASLWRPDADSAARTDLQPSEEM